MRWALQYAYAKDLCEHYLIDFRKYKLCTLTGNAIRECDLVDRSSELMTILDKFMMKPVQLRKANRGVPGSFLSDEAVIAKALASKQGEKFRSLREGNIPEGMSHSEADLSYCTMLAFGCGGDTDQMDRLFQESGLMRDKWNRDDYRIATLNKAVAMTTEFYKPFGDMNVYENMCCVMEDNAHLISMIPVEELVRFGYEIGLKPGMKVLDLCCGYGTLLKIWHEAFGIQGVGVDREKSFLGVGAERLEKQGIDNVLLSYDDVTKYQDETEYDVVICSETIDSIENTFSLGRRFLKPGGILCYQKLYAKVSEPPQELVDFDGEVLPLSALNHCFNDLGWYMTAMASDTPGMWEHYVVNWCGRRLWEEGADPAWIKTWYDMYFDYRRQYEGQAMFALREIKEIVKCESSNLWRKSIWFPRWIWWKPYLLSTPMQKKENWFAAW